MRAFSSVIAAFVLLVASSAQAVHFTAPVFLDKTKSATCVAVADIDGDGALDVVAAVPDGIEILYGDMRGGVRETEVIPTPARTQSIVLSDLNRDGVADIIATTNDGVWNILSSGRHYTAPQRAGKPDPVVVTMIDINGDGLPDKVTMDGRSKALFVELADGRGGFGLERTIEMPDVVTSFAVADFDGDGKVDIAASTAFSNQISILLGDGRGGFIAADSIDAGEVPVAIAAGDIDRNGHIDLVVAYAKGIAFIPNISQRPPRTSPEPGRRMQSESLHAVQLSGVSTLVFQAVVFDPTIGAYQWSDPNNWVELDASGVPDGVHRVPTANDFVSSSSNSNFPLAIIGSAIAGGIDSGYLSIGSPHPVPGGGFPAGSLQIGAQGASFGTLQIEQGSVLSSSVPVVVRDLSMFGGSISATGALFTHGFQVTSSVLWEGGSITVLGGADAFFAVDSTVFGQVQLCTGTTLNLGLGTTLSLNGIVEPCPSGSGTLSANFATINGVADNFPGIFTNFQGDTATINVTGTGPLNIFGVGGFNPSQSLGRSVAHLGAGTTLNLGAGSNLFFADGLTTDGLGTTVAGGLRGVTTVNNPLTVIGTLGGAPTDRADFTNANGPVNLMGSIIAHGLTINGSGSQLNHVCLGNGGIVDLRSDMTTTGSGFINGCGGTGEFRVNFRGGSLTIANSLLVDPSVEFEGDGTINLQSGQLQLGGSPIGYTAFGNYNLAAGTKVVAFGPFGFGGRVSGDGVLEVDGPLHAQGATINNLNAGNADGAFTVTGNMLWRGGTISSGQATIASGATLNANANGGAFFFSNTFVQINGTANLVSACVTNGASFNVNFNGVANVSPPLGTIALGTCGSNGSLRINQNGKLLVNVTGRSAMVIPSSIFGTLEVAGNGTLSYLAPSTWFPALQQQLIVDGGTTMDFEDTETFPLFDFQALGGGAVVFDFSTFSGSPVFFGNPVTFNNAHFTGGGNMVLGCCFNTSAVSTNLTIDSGNTMTIGWGLSVGTGAHITNNGTIQNNGTLSMSTGNSAINGSGVINNGGTISGGSPTGTTSIDNAINNGNFGRIVANTGSLFPTNLTNVSGGLLTGGSYEADSNSTLLLPSVTDNAASLSANGGRIAFNNLQSNTPTGSVFLGNGGTISGAGAFTNNGTLAIGAGSAFTAGGYTQAAGKTSLTDSSAQLNAPSVLQGGVLEGYGVIAPSLQNLGGDLQPDLGTLLNHTPGTLTVRGNYSEGAGAHLHVFINSQTQYSSLHITGTATLAGTVQIDPVVSDDGSGDQTLFFPNPGDAFKVLTYGLRVGTFPTIVGQDQTFIQDYIYIPHYNANDLTFVVEPTDPKIMIANLEGTIGGFGLDNGTLTGLMAKLDGALSSLKRGDASSACGQLSAAVNFTNAQVDKKITTAQSAVILDALARIRTRAGCM